MEETSRRAADLAADLADDITYDIMSNVNVTDPRQKHLNGRDVQEGS